MSLICLIKTEICLFACSGGGPVLGGRSRGVGQSRAAATQNETPGGMSEDLGRTVLCREYRALRRLSFLMICWLCVYTISAKLCEESVSFCDCYSISLLGIKTWHVFGLMCLWVKSHFTFRPVFVLKQRLWRTFEILLCSFCVQCVCKQCVCVFLLFDSGQYDNTRSAFFLFFSVYSC